MSKVLVVDDKEMMRDSVSTMLARQGHTIITATSAKSALEKVAERPIDAIVTDFQMPEMDGVQLLEEVRKIDEQLPVIVMTAYGTVDTAVKAMKLGAYDFITKPFAAEVLVATVERALERARLVKENSILKAAATPAGNRGAKTKHEMIGTGPAMIQLRERLTRIADSHGTVMVNGESGSGKEVAARWIHEQSPRAGMPFLAINCAALSTSLLESELFGHEKGAFTGADKLRKGRFELADGGTLLLDEISEIAPEIQAKLLRVLQERTFERVGSSTPKAVDVRVIATTNRDLPAEVARGTFRQDLYFRLNVLPVHMPALRSHADDIPALAEHFLDEVATREGKSVKSIEPAALELMMSYPWPGNVREMQNICERATVHTHDDTIRATLIAPWLTGDTMSFESSFSHPGASRNGSLSIATTKPASMIEVSGPIDPSLSADLPAIVCDGKVTLEQIERQVIVATLVHNGGHRQRTARDLDIGVRTLGLKLKKWKEQKLVAETL